ncbi:MULTISPECIES: hypothetical protein [unclassified Streptomyces]|nr:MULTISPECIES: hypothetical protein [unclassified Streptomyces]
MGGVTGGPCPEIGQDRSREVTVPLGAGAAGSGKGAGDRPS